MRQIDLPLQIDHLRTLGNDFNALRSTVTALDAQPGSGMLQQLGPKILAAHELIGRTLVRLSALDGSQYTAVPGSRAALETLGEVVVSASVAAAQLSRAVADNPLEAAPFATGQRFDDALARQARHTEAAPLLAESLTTAVHHLDLCATCCQYTASGIARDLKEHPEHLPEIPQLTGAQYKTLDTIAQGGVRQHRRLGGGISVRAGNGSSIHATPFAVLQKHRLVRVSAASSPLAEQDVTVTALGRLALDIQLPGPTPSQGNVPEPRKPKGRHR
ncbi:hypothetical protein ACFW5D_30175 [Streptomyces sp. NPDC058770]|uniref:hypothetical protein n=1 Tax=Streptomyces sp. NPDC058770 TaxID=3346631 RepID=UPI0036BD6F9C